MHNNGNIVEIPLDLSVALKKLTRLVSLEVNETALYSITENPVTVYKTKSLYYQQKKKSNICNYLLYRTKSLQRKREEKVTEENM